jgi:hypothetical protein
MNIFYLQNIFYEHSKNEKFNYLWEILLFFETFYYFFISWKADILPTTILLDPIVDDYLKQLELMIFLFGTTNIH